MKDVFLYLVLMKWSAFLVFLTIVCGTGSAQVVPAGRLADWDLAGYNGTIPNPSQTADVMSFGAVGDGITNDLPSIVSAINSLSGPGVVYFPPGQYLITNTLNIPDGVIFRGAGADSTSLNFDFNGGGFNCIEVFKYQSGSWSSALSPCLKGSDYIILDSIQNFNVGGYCEIVQDNGAWDTIPAVWAAESIGQLLKITSISGDTLFIEHSLRFDYDSVLDPRLRMVNPAEDVGIECLQIRRIDAPTGNAGYNIYMSYAANCWIKGLESNKSAGAHALILRSTNVEISGSYFHDAFSFTGSNTRGYGVVLAEHSGECLITNNIFRRLRHAMMIKQGANCNVFSFNYSYQPLRSEFPIDAGGDINVHGHFPYSNLFEHNICQNIVIDQAWGPSGPDNLFFRNRADLYGIVMSSGAVESDGQIFVGNEVPNADFLKGNYILAGTGHFEHGNNIKGSIIPAGTGVLGDQSYYLSSSPQFWNIPFNWPSIGIPNAISSGEIPARDRQLNSTVITLCANVISGTPEVQYGDEESRIFPVPSEGEINYIFEKAAQFKVYDSSGRQVYESVHPTLEGQFHAEGAGSVYVADHCCQ